MFNFKQKTLLALYMIGTHTHTHSSRAAVHLHVASRSGEWRTQLVIYRNMIMWMCNETTDEEDEDPRKYRKARELQPGGLHWPISLHRICPFYIKRWNYSEEAQLVSCDYHIDAITLLRSSLQPGGSWTEDGSKQVQTQIAPPSHTHTYTHTHITL
jgi:hypothetical protein